MVYSIKKHEMLGLSCAPNTEICRCVSTFYKG